MEAESLENLDGDAPMRIYTRIFLDWNGNILESESYDYSGPLILCDRSLQAQAEQAGKTAASTAGNYGSAAEGIAANVVPRLESEAVNPPGYGPFGLSEMETAAESSGAGATGAAQERARLEAMRTGNRAGIGAITAGAAGEGARGAGSALQSILAKNAELKASQREQANRGLEGVLGEDIGAQGRAEGVVPEDINAAVNAGKSGWFQNLVNMLAAIRGGTPSAGGAGSSRGGGAGSMPDEDELAQGMIG